MNSAASVAHVADQYRAALLEYVKGREETALLGGYEIGRRALGDGLGILDIATIHSRAVSASMEHHDAAPLVDAQMSFFFEALSPFEMAHRAFRDANAMLRRLNEVLEGQAKRIAYALHSEAGQLLASVHFALAEAGRDLPPEKAVQMTNVRSLLVEIENRLRNLSHDLRPTVLDDLGLRSAIELLADGVSQRWGLAVHVNVAVNTDLPAAIENTVYRITQEALTNAAKHAEATRVDVDVVQADHSLTCSVRDDGVGLDSTGAFRKRRPGLGLTEIRESIAALGGVFRLGLNHDRGTELSIEIPLDV